MSGAANEVKFKEDVQNWLKPNYIERRKFFSGLDFFIRALATSIDQHPNRPEKIPSRYLGKVFAHSNPVGFKEKYFGLDLDTLIPRKVKKQSSWGFDAALFYGKLMSFIFAKLMPESLNAQGASDKIKKVYSAFLGSHNTLAQCNGLGDIDYREYLVPEYARALVDIDKKFVQDIAKDLSFLNLPDLLINPPVFHDERLLGFSSGADEQRADESNKFLQIYFARGAYKVVVPIDPHVKITFGEVFRRDLPENCKIFAQGLPIYHEMLIERDLDKQVSAADRLMASGAYARGFAPDLIRRVYFSQIDKAQHEQSETGYTELGRYYENNTRLKAAIKFFETAIRYLQGQKKPDLPGLLILIQEVYKQDRSMSALNYDDDLLKHYKQCRLDIGAICQATLDQTVTPVNRVTKYLSQYIQSINPSH